MYCQLHSITSIFSQYNTFLTKKNFIFFNKACWATQKTISILMHSIYATFRPLLLHNICSHLLHNQIIIMLISHFHNILNIPVVFDHIPTCDNKATRWILTKSPCCNRLNLCISQLKGEQSYFPHFHYLFH